MTTSNTPTTRNHPSPQQRRTNTTSFLSKKQRSVSIPPLLQFVVALQALSSGVISLSSSINTKNAIANFRSIKPPRPTSGNKRAVSLHLSKRNNADYDMIPTRRDILTKIAMGVTSSLFYLPHPTARAAIVDETSLYTSEFPSQSPPLTSSPSAPLLPPSSPSDEVTLVVPLSTIRSEGLGLELTDIVFRTNRRVVIKSIRENSVAAQYGIQQNWVVVSVNGRNAERTDAKGVRTIVSEIVSGKSDSNGYLTLVFRDPSLFRERLNSLGENNDSFADSSVVTTRVAPEGDTTQRNPDGSVKAGRGVTSQTSQDVSVSQLIPPRMCGRRAREDDLLEISYVGTVLDTGTIFDGSTVRINGEGIPGRGGDVSLFFVLGKQPFGQFPPGWDVGLVGMCVGERRRLIIPPVLAYGSVGLPRRGIPPDATLQYDVTLISINGNALPQ